MIESNDQQKIADAMKQVDWEAAARALYNNGCEWVNRDLGYDGVYLHLKGVAIVLIESALEYSREACMDVKACSGEVAVKIDCEDETIHVYFCEHYKLMEQLLA